MSKDYLKKFSAVILAAGQGKRLNLRKSGPKAMLKLAGKPMVSYIVSSLRLLGFSKEQICLVAGFESEKITAYFKNSVSYALQDKPQGTAHAAFCGIKILPRDIEQVLVLNADDSAFYSPATLESFMKQHYEAKPVLSLLSVEPDYPEQYGRIIRSESGKILIVEKENLTKEQRQIKETSTGTFCFDRKWFEESLPQIKPIPGLKEYGLPSMLELANKEKALTQVIKLANPREWFGVNTLQELREADQRMKLKVKRLAG